MTDQVIKLNTESFEELYQKEGKLVVRLWAEWCGPCKMMSPIYNQVADNIADEKLIMGEVDIDAFPAIATKLGVRGIPTVVIFENGKEVNRSVGLMPAPELQKLILKE
ncbi:thioredoxin domain-containing protein [uncultured Psychromonas sp.]|uniref:thioredoxin family protein n=1 Tax=uncultured Psychromonas sp. TaxID=173974 RepID=UPI002626BB1C|nr:thioredoxin domain-containing protein [uncultured Psychromonas sp.]